MLIISNQSPKPWTISSKEPIKTQKQNLEKSDFDRSYLKMEELTVEKEKTKTLAIIKSELEQRIKENDRF